MQQNKSLKEKVAEFKTSNKQSKRGKTYDYLEALTHVRDLLGNQLESNFQISKKNKEEEKTKNKEHFRENLEKTKKMITTIVMEEGILVRNYEENKIYLFIEEVAQDIVGYSILSDAFEDPTVSDIFIQSWNNIYVEKEKIGDVKYEKTFHSPEHYEDVVNRFLKDAKKEVNNGDKKIVDFELYGDRGVVISSRITPKGFTVALRKHSEDHIQMKDIILSGVVSPEIAKLLGYIIEGESNLIYAGITGTGKTTTLRALLDYTVQKLNKRMITAEDTQELFPKNDHTVEMLSFKSEKKELEVDLNQIILTTLRMKPKYIVVGEVRGKEAQAAVEAMETGHSTIFSMHGGDAWNCVNRLVTKYLTAMPSLGIDVVERIIGSAVDYICIQDNIPNVGRRMTSMVEVSYDFKEKRIALKTIIDFDVVNDEFKIVNKLSPVKIKHMLRRGLAWEDIQAWTHGSLEDVYRIE